jgi:hypothetical protein
VEELYISLGNYKRFGTKMSSMIEDASLEIRNLWLIQKGFIGDLMGRRGLFRCYQQGLPKTL